MDKVDDIGLTIRILNGKITIKSAEIDGEVSAVTAANELKKELFVDFGTHPIKPTKGREPKGDICPYCQSTDTMGNGSRTTQKEFQKRRLCNSCHRTFIAGREEKYQEHQTEEKSERKATISFLDLLDFSKIDIADLTGLSWSTVNATLKKVESERELDSLRNYYTKTELDKMISGEHQKIMCAPEFKLNITQKDRLGKSTTWDYDGRMALQNKSHPNKVVYLFKKDISIMMALNKSALVDAIGAFGSDEQKTILNFIEDKKDDKMGILPKTHIFTRVAEDGGELNADLMVSAAHKDEENGN